MPRLTRRPTTHSQAYIIQPNQPNPRHHYGRYSYRTNLYENAPKGAPSRVSQQIDKLLAALATLSNAAEEFANTDFSGYGLTRWQKALLISAGGELAVFLEDASEEFDSATLRAFGEMSTRVDVFRGR